MKAIIFGQFKLDETNIILPSGADSGEIRKKTC